MVFGASRGARTLKLKDEDVLCIDRSVVRKHRILLVTVQMECTLSVSGSCETVCSVLSRLEQMLKCLNRNDKKRARFLLVVAL